MSKTNMNSMYSTKQRSKITIGQLNISESTLAWILVLAIILIMFFNLAFLTKYPSVFVDESWNANAAWTWLTTGNNFDSMHAGTLDQFGYEWLRWPKIGNLPWTLSFAVLGLGIWQARLVPWIFGCLLVIFIILVGRRSYSTITGVIAAMVLSLSLPFLQASHYSRWDIMLAAVIMLAYWLVLVGLEDDKWWANLLSGLLISLAFDIHQNALLFILGLGVLYVAHYGKRVLKSKGAWLFSAGVLLGVGYYLAVYILPNPDAFFGLFSLSLGNTHQVPIMTFNPLELLKSARAEIGRYHFYESNLEFVLIGASFAYLAVRRSKPDRLLLTFILAVLAGFVLIIGNKHDIYAILLYPFFMLMVAETLISLIRDWRAYQKSFVFVLMILVLLLVNSGIHFIRPIMSNRNYNYYAITEQIKPGIPSGARVVGYPTWWLGLAEYDYRSSFNLTYYQFINGYSLTEGFEKLQPDILIVDDNLRGLLVDEGAYKTSAGFEIYNLPRGEFEEYIAMHGEKINEFTDPWHGRFEIYAIR